MRKFFFRLKYFYVILFTCMPFVFFHACKRDNDANERIKNYNSAKSNVNIERFDIAFYKLDTMRELVPQLEDLNRKYAGAVDLLLTGIFGMQTVTEGNARAFYHRFRQAPLSDSLFRDVFNKFDTKNTQGLEKSLSDVMARHQSVFPTPAPRFISMVSFFNLDVDTFRNNIVLGLDMFMGSGYRYYRGNEHLPLYVVRRLDEAYIAPRVARKLYEKQVDPVKGKTFLDYMIRAGKRLYYQQALLPESHDTLIFELTKAQLEWNKDNESRIWKNLLVQNLMYSSNDKQFEGYFVEGPFTNATGVPQESSPRLGEWIGYQIVAAYAQKSGANIKDLLNEPDSRKILSVSRYRP